MGSVIFRSDPLGRYQVDCEPFERHRAQNRVLITVWDWLPSHGERDQVQILATPSEARHLAVMLTAAAMAADPGAANGDVYVTRSDDPHAFDHLDVDPPFDVDPPGGAAGEDLSDSSS